jgi:flagellar biosynthesis protein FlhG
MSMPALTQAQQLTRWVSRKAPRVRVLAVTSGKGGVGKTNVVVNLAARLCGMGHRVLVLDGDLGLGNVDVMVGLSPTRSLADVFAGSHALEEVIVQGPNGVRVVPGGSGVSALTHLGEEGQLRLLSEVARLSDPPDFLLIDTGAGIGPNVRFLVGCAQEILVVVTPEPTSVTDAYALMKVMALHHGERRFRLLVNLARSAAEAAEVYRRLSLAVDRFLGVAVDLAGWVPEDAGVGAAVRAQRGVAGSAAGDAYAALARTVAGWRTGFPPKGGVQFFVNRVAVPEAAPAASQGG